MKFNLRLFMRGYTGLLKDGRKVSFVGLGDKYFPNHMKVLCRIEGKKKIVGFFPNGKNTDPEMDMIGLTIWGPGQGF